MLLCGKFFWQARQKVKFHTFHVRVNKCNKRVKGSHYVGRENMFYSMGGTELLLLCLLVFHEYVHVVI